MSQPLAYTYEADTHCPPCTVARFGRAAVTTYSGTVLADFPPESAADSEGNPVGAIFPWDEWHEPGLSGRFTLTCGTCSGVIAECNHGGSHEPEPTGLRCTDPGCTSCVGKVAP